MEEALDPDDLAVGADASVLIDLVEGKRLPGLEELFPEVAVPALVKVEVKRNIRAHPLNKGILDAPWLSSVAATDPEDLRLIADLHSAWGSSPPENAGEAELIALSLRHGWIAIIEDRTARNTAYIEHVHAVRLTTCAVAGAACGVVAADRAWGLHHGFHARRPAHVRLPVGTTPAERANFDRAIAKTELLVAKLGGPAWPGILCHSKLTPGKIDEVVARTAKGGP